MKYFYLSFSFTK